ncbi:hypothetical protein O181_003421 [Austropuccinia psidii MF-1]|uniref:No apical meristem-associated C-terminal domain-containing protein n=1 Tax=Austropuccinia psidii MF-1 TaxID=1389203 RepID=A0A9Q3GE52_9BASI|nr:hypothetical protein [Austropuccinia psidii MF-1]
MNTATLKFSAIYNSITNNPPSGSSPLDWMKMAKDLYQASNQGTSFKLEAAWDFLCYAPKWAQEGKNAHQEYLKRLLQQSTPSTPSSSDQYKERSTGNSSETNLQSVFSQQSIGTKKAK